MIRPDVAQLRDVAIIKALGFWLASALIVGIAVVVAPGWQRGDGVALGLTALGIAAVNAGLRPMVASLPFPLPLAALAALYVLLDILLLALAAAFFPGFGFAGPAGYVVAALIMATGTVAAFAATGRRRRNRTE